MLYQKHEGWTHPTRIFHRLTINASSSVCCEQTTLAFEARATDHLLGTREFPDYGLTDGLGSAGDDTDESIQLSVWSIRREVRGCVIWVCHDL